MLYFADTNILLRFLNRADPDYTVTRAAVRIINTRGDDVTTAAQNIAEFWNVLTRPVTARGGYGLSVTDAERRLPFIERHFPLLPDHAAAYFEWKRLVVAHGRSYWFGNKASKRPLTQASLRCTRWWKPSSLHRIPTPLKRCWMSHLQALSTIPDPRGNPSSLYVA